MVDAPKPSRREEQARRTRVEVIEAAHRLFIERGYVATSIRAVAAEAGVSEQTIYRVFGDKPMLLRAVIVTAVGGQDGAGALREGPVVGLVADAPTASERLRIFGQVAREAYGRGLAELENVVMSAASADERVAELARFITEQRYEDTRSLVLAILGDAGPAPGIEVTDIIDYVYAVESSPVYTTLTAERDWTTEKYVAWFVEMFERVFLSHLADQPGTRGQVRSDRDALAAPEADPRRNRGWRR